MITDQEERVRERQGGGAREERWEGEGKENEVVRWIPFLAARKNEENSVLGNNLNKGIDSGIKVLAANKQGM